MRISIILIALLPVALMAGSLCTSKDEQPCISLTSCAAEDQSRVEFRYQLPPDARIVDSQLTWDAPKAQLLVGAESLARAAMIESVVDAPEHRRHLRDLLFKTRDLFWVYSPPKGCYTLEIAYELERSDKPATITAPEPVAQEPKEPRTQERIANPYRIGLQIGGSKPDSQTRWSDQALTEADLRETTIEIGLFIDKRLLLGGHHWSVSAALEMAQWDNAQTQSLLLGADYLFERESRITPYLGLRAGYLQFETDLTSDSDSGMVYGPTAGIRTPASAWSQAEWLKSIELGLYVTYLQVGQKTHQDVAAQEKTTTLDSLIKVGLQAGWRF